MKEFRGDRAFCEIKRNIIHLFLARPDSHRDLEPIQVSEKSVTQL